MNPKDLEALVRTMVEGRLKAAGETSRAVSDSDGAADVGRAETLRVVTESDVREAGLGGTVSAAANAIVTAAAEELARAWNVKIQRGRGGSLKTRRVAIASDHGGYRMKEELKKFLETRRDLKVEDLGTHSEKAVDYPDFAHAVAEKVSSGSVDMGIVVDGAGIGSAMAANKVPGIRAALCYDTVTAKNSREHNFANVLCLGGRLIDEARMRQIVVAFLDTPTGEERHAVRVRKIMEIERKYRRN